MTKTEYAVYPFGMEDALARILRYHTGKDKAIGRMAMVKGLANVGFHVGERAVRECIKALRRKSHLICSTPGEGGGYYMAESLAEFEEFDRSEMGAKISDMNETRQAMRAAAKQQFGDASQLGLM
jgi:repressor of nif and glnA expression